MNKKDILTALNRICRKKIDWEQRRYELAKEIMRGFAANPHDRMVEASLDSLAEWSVAGADAMIAELKKDCIH